jgi:hypothetical protein
MIRFITSQDLCRRWDINQDDLAKLVYDGQITGIFTDGASGIQQLILCDEIKTGLPGLIARDDTVPCFSNDDYAYMEKARFTVFTVPALKFALPEVKELERKYHISYKTKPIDLMDKLYPGDSLPAPAQEKLSDKKPIPKPRKAIVYDEAARLQRDYPKMNKVEAKKKIDAILKSNKYLPKYPPYSRTQFNRIISNLKFPSAPRGRKPAKPKK